MTATVTADVTVPAAGFCDALQSPEPAWLRCDLRPDHAGDRHAEVGVASWARDGSDVRWFAGISRATGRPVYRTDTGESTR